MAEREAEKEAEKVEVMAEVARAEEVKGLRKQPLPIGVPSVLQ